MKRLSYLLLASVASIAAVQATSPFSGYYAGLHTGYTQKAIKNSLHANTDIQKRHHNSGLVYGLHAGYGCANTQGGYFGVEATIYNDTANWKHKKYNLGNAAVQVKYKRSAVFGLAPRVGFKTSPNDLIYLKLGAEFSRDHLSHKVTLAGTREEDKSSKHNNFAFVPGVGCEHYHGNNILSRIEYDYNFGNKVKHTSLDGAVSHHAKYTAHKVKVGMSYQF